MDLNPDIWSKTFIIYEFNADHIDRIVLIILRILLISWGNFIVAFQTDTPQKVLVIWKHFLPLLDVEAPSCLYSCFNRLHFQLTKMTWHQHFLPWQPFYMTLLLVLHGQNKLSQIFSFYSLFRTVLSFHPQGFILLITTLMTLAILTPKMTNCF